MKTTREAVKGRRAGAGIAKKLLSPALYAAAGFLLAQGKVFGSVTSDKIASALSELGYEVDKKRITTKETIKNVGTYDAEVRFMEGVVAKIKINVIPLE